MLISILGFLSYCFYVLGYSFPSSSHEEKVVESNFGGGKITLSQFSNQCSLGLWQLRKSIDGVAI